MTVVEPEWRQHRDGYIAAWPDGGFIYATSDGPYMCLSGSTEADLDRKIDRAKAFYEASKAKIARAIARDTEI